MVNATTDPRLVKHEKILHPGGTLTPEVPPTCNSSFSAVHTSLSLSVCVCMRREHACMQAWPSLALVQKAESADPKASYSFLTGIENHLIDCLHYYAVFLRAVGDYDPARRHCSSESSSSSSCRSHPPWHAAALDHTYIHPSMPCSRIHSDTSMLTISRWARLAGARGTNRSMIMNE